MKRWLHRGSGATVLLAFPLGVPVMMNESGTALTAGRRIERSSLRLLCDAYQQEALIVSAGTEGRQFNHDLIRDISQ